MITGSSAVGSQRTGTRSAVCCLVRGVFFINLLRYVGETTTVALPLPRPLFAARLSIPAGRSTPPRWVFYAPTILSARQREQLVERSPPAGPHPARRVSVNSYVALLIAIVTEVVGTSSLKASAGFSLIGPSLMVFVGYGLAFYFRSLAVRSIPLGIVYALWSGIGSVLIVLVGWWIFSQAIGGSAILGIALVVSGCVVLNVFSKTSID